MWMFGSLTKFRGKLMKRRASKTHSTIRVWRSVADVV